MMGYVGITKGAFLSSAIYAFGLFFTFIGNLIYIVMIYFLWKSIYRNSETLNGMTFNQTFVYLALGISIFNLFKTFVDWRISFYIVEGRISIDLIRPLDFQLNMLSEALGHMLFNGLVISIPSMAVVFIFMGGSIPTGINLLFFPISLGLAYILSFTLDYMTGLAAFYTESIWGISITKEVIVTLLSGALIPLQFFPDSVRAVLVWLPFQAIYHSPLQIATATDLDTADYVSILAVQLVWVAAMWVVSRLFYRQAIKVVTINGG